MAEEQQQEPKRSLLQWVQLGAIGIVGLYTLLFIVLNTHRVKVSFVFASARISVIWVILLSQAVGLVLAVLLSRLNRRRKRRG